MSLKYYNQEFTLKYPMNISKLTPKMIKQSEFTTKKKEVYDVSCFSAFKFCARQVAKEVVQKYPDYDFTVYEYRAEYKSPMSHKGLPITRLVFCHNVNDYSKMVHITVQLYADEPKTESKETETETETESESESESEVESDESEVSEVEEDIPLLIPQPLVRSKAIKKSKTTQ